MELHETLAQQEFIVRHKRHKKMVVACRILLLVLFLEIGRAHV